MTKSEKKDESLGAEGKYKALVETAADAIFTLDLLGRFTFVNPAAERIAGYSEGELVGKHFRELLPAKYIPACLNMFQRLLRGQPTPPLEIEMITKQGERVPLELLGSPVKKGRRVVEIIGIARDITERKRAEEALRESDEIFKQFMENSPNYVFFKNDKIQAIRLSSNYEKMLGKPMHELLGKTMDDLFPSDLAKSMIADDLRVLNEGKQITVEEELNGRFYTTIKFPILVKGKPRYLAGYTIDITERKRAQEALRESEERFRSLFENVPIGLYRTTPDGRIVLANPTLVRMLGYSSFEELALRNLEEEGFKPDYPRSQFSKRVEREGEVKDLESAWIRRDGSVIFVRESAKAIRGDDGTVLYYEGTVEVITERKQAEEEIQRSYDIQTTLNALLHISLLDFSLEDQLERILDHILSIPWLALESRGGIFLVEDEPEVLVMKAQRGLATPLQTTCAQVPFGRCLCGRAALTREMQFADCLDDRHETRYEGITPHGHYCVPILFAGKVLGVINMYVKEGHGRDQREEQFLTAVANTIAGIIERKRAEEELRRRIVELATFNEIGRTIASTIKLDQLWDLIYHQTCRVIEVSAFYISLYDREKEKANVVIDILHGQRQPQEEGPHKFHKGRTEYIIRTKKPLLIRGEVQETYDRLGIAPSDKRAKGFAGVPITARGEVIGVLAVQNYERDEAYDERTIDLLSTIADQAAIAIENARLYEETQKRLAETTLLHKVAEAINATLDLKEIFQRVVEELSRTFDYRLADIYLLEGEGLRLQANVGYDAQTILEAIPLARGVVGRVARTGQPAFIRDVSQDPDYIPSYPDIISEICVPIRSGETVLGVLNVECDECRFLTEDDLMLLHTLSSHIGVAIENARLYEEERRRSAERRTIAEVGRRVASILEMDALLPQVVDLIAQNFRYDHVHLFQVDHDSGYAVYKAGICEGGALIAEKGLRLKIGKEGMIGWVAQHGEPLLTNDVSLDPHYIPHPALPDTRSELSVPIRVGEKIVGVLDVQSAELGAFDEGDLETLQTLADQLAVALENARLYEKTQQLAITDGLTGLYNLRHFYEALEKEIQRSERYHRSISLVILDIDDLKAYNDLYGHLAGDDLLKELARLMSKVTRRADTSARYGGDEFAIILPETETEGARVLAQRLLEEVKEHRFSTQDGQTIGRITTSLGVATYPHHADSAKALVDAADKALLRAKGAGKNQLFVCTEGLTEVEHR